MRELKMNNQSIGVFDSGVGGLTVLEELHRALPNEHLIFVGDNAHSPYGDKSVAQLKQYSSEIVEYFLQQQVKMIVLACNTTSCTVLDYLKERYPQVPIIGVIDTTVSMVNAKTMDKVAIMATQATIESQAYQKGIGMDRSIGIACPKLVPLIENGTTQQILHQELHTLLDEVTKECHSIVLGCTHYPIIASDIKALYPHIRLFSSSVAVVGEVERMLEKLKLRHSDASPKKNLVYTTGNLELFKQASRIFFNSSDFIFKKLTLKVA